MRRIGDALHLPSRRGPRLAVILGVLVLATAVGVGAGLGGPTLADRLGIAAGAVPTTPPPPAPVSPRPELRPLGDDAPVPTRPGVAALLDPLLAAAGLGELSGQVVDPATGTVLWARAPESALVPGSTAKLLTAGAALLALDHEASLTTTVIAGPEPGTVVLVGGGDPTLSALPAGAASMYPGAARLDDLVTQLHASGVPVRKVLVDVDRYTGDVLAPGWSPGDVPGGFVAPIVPLMVDGGRADPTLPVTPRTATPAQAAGAELARRLGADPAATGVGAAPPGARVLATVSSPPMADLVATMLNTSDNVLAEALAREVALSTGADPSFAGAADAVLRVLSRHGFDTTGAVLADGSGLSTGDRVSAALLADLLAAAAAPHESSARTVALRPMLLGLPVAGGSGTLAARYGDRVAAAARGWVRAKTGTLTGVNSLAGTVLDIDGRLLVFAVLSNGPDPAAARPRLDELAAALRSCGCP